MSVNFHFFKIYLKKQMLIGDETPLVSVVFMIKTVILKLN